MQKITISAVAISTNITPAIRQGISFLGTRSNDDAKNKLTKNKNFGCSVCGILDHRWHGNDKCKPFVNSKKIIGLRFTPHVK